MLLWLSVAIYAQTDVTKFLGIPVDGSKSEMMQNLIQKGYTRSPYDEEVLEGEFNGTKVRIYVVTNNNKVCRIMVCDVNTLNKTDIKIRFNHLCGQFQNNKKYISASPSSYILGDDEDISYEMTVKNKRYEATYYQILETVDSVELRTMIQSRADAYMEEEMSNEMDKSFSNLTEEQLSSFKKKMTEGLVDLALMEIYSKKSVWFMICELSGKYYITMFYDNEYNRANGEDL